tara:strand:+ start:7114 stop:7320 length:207 start_codon:yes stop_codon:yes gene_type:complete
VPGHILFLNHIEMACCVRNAVRNSKCMFDDGKIEAELAYNPHEQLAAQKTVEVIIAFRLKGKACRYNK